jgi:hypothetical protein
MKRSARRPRGENPTRCCTPWHTIYYVGELTYRDNLMQMIEAKKEGQKVAETPEPQMAPVIDIMEALKRSLAEKKKRVQAATAAVAGEKKRLPRRRPRSARAGRKQSS